ncbi:CD63 antigen [Takifugu flavidus]|uniref:Tetraspanin n=1 Tax=Takifugu flavidus TaxID=433684 RepID=A0A5C6MQH0_9TELE|nr:CD63 antigen [Takifugu flavidus]XP_056896688.1 CD63 antigen [Takifugu flavidus]TWW57039.1 CD63 antigen [Takifugu flavidus]
MGVEGGMKLVKFLVFFFNFIFWLCGVALIVVGVLAQFALHNTYRIKDASASGVPIVIIGVGVVIFFIAFFGCCGAWKENYCMITTFAILLALVIIVEIAAAIAGYVFRNKLGNIVQDSLADAVSNYKNGTDDFRKTVDKMQEDLKCCGMNSSSDWRSFADDGNSVPDSCCITVAKGCGKNKLSDESAVYQKGCHDVIVDLLKSNIQWVIVAALVIAFLQLMGLVFACLLMRGIRSGYDVM